MYYFSWKKYENPKSSENTKRLVKLQRQLAHKEKKSKLLQNKEKIALCHEK